MAVKIRLKRMGKIRQPYYRIVVADSRTRRDGRVIEEIGKYHPKHDPSVIEVVSERAQYWLGVGAQPTEAVAALLKITGDWQKFTGEPGAEGTLKVAEPKKSKQEIFNEILKESGGSLDTEAVTKKAEKKPAKKAAAEETPEATAATAEAGVEATGGDATTEDTPAVEATGASSEGIEDPAAPVEAASESTETTES
ncbi:small subunit ribosomal protein S16 [Marmoricola bigeumensis]|uniref:Small ribosomal subunit protein bS16 n=1 Tax=Nocardioides marmoribigeumensis TaxID=433649 RepID=A0ABU2BT61_9ACTN|nr:small subunit ribosomal protein S16 [Nocardioides marmoribigeumensis]